MTKPEGPAQEPQKWIGEDGRPHDHTSFCKANGCKPVPATPTPSQPAGAREWRFSHPERPDDIDEMLEAYATYRIAQQTAAKDAEIADLRRQRDLEWDSRKAASSGRIAAERERDSLREENAALKAGKE